MRRFLIGGEWELSIEDELFEPRSLGDCGNGHPITHLIQKNVYDVARNLWCFEALLDLLPDRIDWVVEYCGGVGGFSILVRELLGPDYHVICDLDTLCCNHLLRLFPSAIVARGDYNIMAGAFESAMSGVGLSVADFNTFTVGRLYKESLLRRTLARMQIAGSYAIITDSAKSYLHLNADSYSELMGVTITDFESYCQAMDEYMATYGKMVVAVAYHFRAAYILIADRVDGNVIQYIPAAADAKGWFKEIL